MDNIDYKCYRVLMWAERKNPYLTMEIEHAVDAVSRKQAEDIALAAARAEYPDWQIDLLEGETVDIS